jgi:hypothetical protein
MAINYTWDCKTCNTYPTKGGKSNVVHKVYWRLTATDDTNVDGNGNNWTFTVYDTQVLNTDDLSSFINWSSLKESDVQGWVEAAIGEDRVKQLKDGLAAQIAKKVTPKSVKRQLAS